MSEGDHDEYGEEYDDMEEHMEEYVPNFKFSEDFDPENMDEE
jgi:hypothetical protein